MVASWVFFAALNVSIDEKKRVCDTFIVVILFVAYLFSLEIKSHTFRFRDEYSESQKWISCVFGFESSEACNFLFIPSKWFLMTILLNWIRVFLKFYAVCFCSDFFRSDFFCSVFFCVDFYRCGLFLHRFFLHGFFFSVPSCTV